MKNKVKMLCYECKKCKKTTYFLSNTDYDTKCKTCNNEMQFRFEKNYNPNRSLKAIDNSNIKEKTNTEFTDKLTVECPYCHQTNTTKITNTSKVIHTVIFGVFSMTRNSKQWHCNNCNSDF